MHNALLHNDIMFESQFANASRRLKNWKIEKRKVHEVEACLVLSIGRDVGLLEDLLQEWVSYSRVL